MNTISPKERFLQQKTKEKVDWLQVNYIIKEVSNDFNVESKMVLSASRKQIYVMPRHICQYIMFYKMELGASAIARIFNRDHSSVYHSVTSVYDFLTSKFDNPIKSYLNSKQWL